MLRWKDNIASHPAYFYRSIQKHGVGWPLLRKVYEMETKGYMFDPEEDYVDFDWDNWTATVTLRDGTEIGFRVSVDESGLVLTRCE